jgi:hypothetical protein
MQAGIQQQQDIGNGQMTGKRASGGHLDVIRENPASLAENSANNVSTDKLVPHPGDRVRVATHHAPQIKSGSPAKKPKKPRVPENVRFMQNKWPAKPCGVWSLGMTKKLKGFLEKLKAFFKKLKAFFEKLKAFFLDHAGVRFFMSLLCVFMRLDFFGWVRCADEKNIDPPRNECVAGEA